MKSHFILKLSLLLLMLTANLGLVNAQDSLKKTVASKTTAPKSAAVKTVTPVKPGGIPINPKTGRPYSRYGYGAYAKTYKAKVKTDSLRKVGTAQTPAPAANTAVAPVPQVGRRDSTLAAPVKIDKSLNGQYQYLLTKVYNYQKPFVDAFRKNFNDSLKAVRTQLQASNQKITEQAKTIIGLQTDVTEKEDALAKTDTISFLGIALSKSTYNIIMWGLVIVFGLIAGIVVARSGGAQKEAAYRTGLYNDLEEEFKTFKAKANEKEKKLARELQTERNKVDELMGRG